MILRSFLLLLGVLASAHGASYHDLDAPEHRYRERVPQDRFTRMKDRLERGEIALDHSSEKACLLSLLAALEVPVSSQTLVFSTTSLQLRLITPSNPRALYFNEDVYIGYIPGGRLEIIALDPELGGIFYLCNLPETGESLRAERSERCMNCHAADQTAFVPGLVLKSVIPGPTGGSLTAFRQEKTGHGIPFSERFGGWYVTGGSLVAEELGNVVGRLSAGTLTKTRIDLSQRVNTVRYPRPDSDILPQLLLEHQAGFVNRVVEAGYRARSLLHAGREELSQTAQRELDAQAAIVTRYILFADEVPLPAGGVSGEPSYKADFLRDRRPGSSGAALKDFDLQTRLFSLRCSYMIYSPIFTALPAQLKARVYQQMGKALATDQPDPEYAYLSPVEKDAIRTVLRTTLSDLPKDW